MTEEERDICIKFVFEISHLCGQLAYTISISEDPEERAWSVVSVKHTRDQLLKYNDKFIENIKLFEEGPVK